MGVFQKVSNWLTDRGDRFIREEADTPESYYASSEAEQVYGRMGGETPGEMDDDQDNQGARHQPIVPFEQTDKYGGRVPYRSQKDVQTHHASLEMERQYQLQEEQARGHAPYTPMQQAQQPYSPSMSAPLQNPAMSSQAQSFPPQPPQAGGYPPQQQAQPNNVVMFPGMFPTPKGGTYTHMEYIVLLRGRNECKNVIEYIKANASVFLNMEFIASGAERQRCVDMLSGAAYTLGCYLNKISPRGIYLISAPSVHVVIDPAMQKFASAPETQGFPRPSNETNYDARRQTTAGHQGSAYAQGISAAAQQPRAPTAPAPTAYPDRYGQQAQFFNRR